MSGLSLARCGRLSATDASPPGPEGEFRREPAHPVPARPARSPVRLRWRRPPESDPAAGPPPGHGRRDDDEDGRDDDADDPPDPVDAAGCLDAQSSGDVVADQHAADAAEQGQPERDVVPVAGSDELAQQSDDDACDENSDDLHDEAFHSGVSNRSHLIYTATSAAVTTPSRVTSNLHKRDRTQETGVAGPTPPQSTHDVGRGPWYRQCAWVAGRPVGPFKSSATW